MLRKNDVAFSESALHERSEHALCDITTSLQTALNYREDYLPPTCAERQPEATSASVPSPLYLSMYSAPSVGSMYE